MERSILSCFSKGLEYGEEYDGEEKEHRDFVEESVEHVIVLVAIVVNCAHIAATYEVINNEKCDAAQFQPHPRSCQVISRIL